MSAFTPREKVPFSQIRPGNTFIYAGNFYEKDPQRDEDHITTMATSCGPNPQRFGFKPDWPVTPSNA